MVMSPQGVLLRYPSLGRRARCRLGCAGMGGDAAACLAERAVDWQLLVHDEDFPGIPIGIREPEFVLSGKAAGLVVFDSLQHAGGLQSCLPLCDLFERIHFNAEMVDR